MSYIVDPNDNKKQVPKAMPDSYYGRASTPAVKTLQERPNYVLINMNGTYAFNYNAAKFDAVGTFVTGSVVDDAAGPVRLDISPVSWRQTDAAGTIGDVTFVYTRIK